MGLNKIIQGENMQIMRGLPAGKIDLIYIDPPYCTQRNFKSNASGKKIGFRDKWEMGERFYMRWLIARLQECHRLLKDTGVLCLHLDWRAVHYAKVELDQIFGQKNFINEIIWAYNGGGTGKRYFSKKHDTILVYSKNNNYVFNISYKPYKEITESVQKHSSLSGGYKIDIERGTPITDVWSDIKTVTGWSPEKRGYPTQKPLVLLKRIIEAFTNQGEIIADFFCGSGTTLVAAQQLKRNYLGVDISSDAVKISQRRLATPLNKADY